jgi:hypothetical protein
LDKLAGELEGYTKKCVVSFLDMYGHIEKRLKALRLHENTEERAHALARSLSGSAVRHGMTLETCAESADLGAYAIAHGRCVDAGLIRYDRRPRAAPPKG